LMHLVEGTNAPKPAPPQFTTLTDRTIAK
jgi:hypothetical protein